MSFNAQMAYIDKLLNKQRTKFRTRTIGKHVKDCYALEHYKTGFWSTPWACPEHVFADSMGRFQKNCHRSWIKWLCNNFNCKAEFMVSEDDILKLVQGDVK